jgi:multidrug resistance efflux pump
LAVCGFSFALYRVLGARQEPPPKPPLNAPAESPYGRAVAGSGITEARTENIAIGAAVPGLVTEVVVKVGDVVGPGQPLFRIDDRALTADLNVRQAMLKAAEAQLDKLKHMPRPEEIGPSEFRVAEAEARVVEAQDRYRRAESLFAKNAVSEEQFIKAKQDNATADKVLKYFEAQHKLLLAGAWSEDLQIAEAAVVQERAQVEKIRTELERLEVRAPLTMDVVDFKVLQVNVRPGEFVGAPPSQALIVLGDIDNLHVRVDIDEHDIPRFDAAAPAIAKLRGDPGIEFELTFVRVEPYVIPKRSLTGDNTERVDTRVLQVIYALEKTDEPVYVGQQMDVFIQAKGRSTAPPATVPASATTPISAPP